MFARIIFSGAAVMALAITVFTTGDALAGKGGNGGGGNYTGTITFAAPATTFPQSTDAEAWPSWGDSVTFAVTANVREGDLYNLWTVNRCSQNGVTVSLAFAPVDDGLAGPVGLEWPGGGAAECTAHVETFEGKPVRGASMTYAVGP
jgi:hypothetical protein